MKEIIILSRGWLLQLITGAQTHYMIGRGGEECGEQYKLDPVGSTVRYEMMKLCAGLV